MKRLYKSENDKKISGVCAGFAEYLDIDPTLVRAIYLFLDIITGVIMGIIAYIALAIIMPTKNEVSKNA
jgi:phage shock protein C